MLRRLRKFRRAKLLYKAEKAAGCFSSSYLPMLSIPASSIYKRLDLHIINTPLPSFIDSINLQINDTDSNTHSPSPTNTSTPTMTTATPATFPFPPTYFFPPFFTPQPNSATRLAQLQKWSSLIQAWCRHHRIYRLSLVEAVDSPLFHNAALRKRLSLSEVRNVVDWMARGEEDGGGGKRAEWADGASKTLVWIWWRRPEEWAGIVEDWVCFSFLSLVLSFLFPFFFTSLCFSSFLCYFDGLRGYLC